MKYKLTSGVGKGIYQLVAFDAALIGAGISNYNLLKVSSILPPASQKEEHISVVEGSPLLIAYGAISSNTLGEKIAAAVGVGIPVNPKQVGVIMEFAGKCSADEAKKQVVDMVRIGMLNHGIPYKEIETSCVEAVVSDDKWVSVISAIPLWKEIGEC